MGWGVVVEWLTMTGIKATILALGVSLGMLGLTYGFASLLRSEATGKPGPSPYSLVSAKSEVMAPPGSQFAQGRSLFERNCASCHGDDARGDEGPDLHNLRLSDGRIAKRIREGVKGEMPRFGSKLHEADIAAVIVYLRSL